MNKKELMHNLMLSLSESWCEVGVDKNGKAVAKTNSEIAANALVKILHDIGCIEGYKMHPTTPTYYKYIITTSNCWTVVFKEL